MRQLGKVGKQWLRTRKEWIKLHPPNHQGYYVCAICGFWVQQNEIEIDHIVSRSRAPELRFDLNNLQPLCHRCNQQKGSHE